MADLLPSSQAPSGAFSAPEFDYDEQASVVNANYIGGLDASSNFAADLFGGTVASVVDFGATVFNSLAPERYETSTAALLSHINDNALRVYQENRDTVELASFIGGVFAPAGLALKGINALKSGTKALSMFGTERRAADLVKLEELARGGAARTTELNALRNSIYGRGLAGQVLDAAAMEVAIITAMNAHPFMEDYLEDPVKHFAISMAIGGAIGGGIGHIADRFAVKQAIGKAEADTFKAIASNLTPVPAGLPTVDAIQVRQHNIDAMQKMLDDKVNPLSGLGTEWVNKVLLGEREAQEKTLESLVSRFVDTKDVELRAAMLDRFANDERFQTIDRARMAKITEKLMPNGGVQLKLDDEFGQSFGKKIDKETLEESEVNRTRIFIPEADGFGTLKELAAAGRANALKGVTADSVMKHSSVSQTAILAPNIDAGLMLKNASAPSVDKAYAEAFSYVDSLKDKMLGRAAVSPDDLPLISAILMRARKDPDAYKDLKVILTRKEPQYTDEILQRVFKKEGVSADHHKRMLDFTNPQVMTRYDLTAGGVSTEAKLMLEQWKNGSGVARMRTAADAAMYGGYGKIGVNATDIALFKELRDSAQSVELRQQFMKIADSSGHVYLWRGMTQNPTGHVALQSYTTDFNKAREFGQPRLFKVHVDDIVGGIRDLASKDGLRHNEIIVRAPKRDIEPTLPVGLDGTESPASAVAAKVVSKESMDLQQLTNYALDLKEKLIREMVGEGRSLLEVAIRTNTPRESVEEFVVGLGMKGSLTDITGSKGLWEYNSVEAIKAKLSTMNQPLAVSTNIRKKSWGEAAAKLDVSSANRLNNQVLEAFMRGSKSAIAEELNGLLFTDEAKKLLDVFRSQVHMAVDNFAGNRFIESADSFTRHMGDLGAYATQFGKNISDMGNHIIKSMTKEILPEIEKVAANPVMRTELSTALHLNATLKGWREFKDGKFWVKEVSKDLEGKTVTKIVPAQYHAKPYTVKSPEVGKILEQFGKAGQEIYEARNTVNKILGKPDMPNIGFWVPAFNPREKFIAYLHNKADGTTQLIVGNTEDELKAAVALVKPAYQKLIDDGTAAIFTKSDQGAVSLMAGRDDPIFMSVANSDKLHGGSSAQAIVKSNADPLGELITGLEHSVKASITSLAEVALYDVSDNLQRLSAINKSYTKNQPLSRIKAALNRPKDAAAEVRNIMFDLKSLPGYTTWQDMNSGFEGGIGYVLQKITQGWESVYKPAGLFSSKKPELDYAGFEKLLKKQGVLNPYEVFGKQAEEIWKLGGRTDVGNQAKRAVSLANSYVATAALRFGDLAQPLVNAMSMPILMTGAIADKMPSSFMGAKLAGSVHPVQAMHDGIRAMNSPAFKHWDDAWKAKGYYDPIVSEASQVLQLPRELTPGLMTSLEKAAESRIVTTLARPADWMETTTRKVAMFTGATIAKRLYPELGDAGVTLFARNFMDRVIGNYHAAQRPIFFQGTIGTAMGLFQTYMLTFAQGMYRQLELKNYKALGKTMLAQGTIFGAASLPGFNQVSELIGEHYSDDHVDLKTGAIRALDDDAAKMLLFGLPSSLGPAVYTRGDLAPRISTPANLSALPQVEMISQTVQTVGRVAGALGADFEAMPRTIGQALAMQSVVRPIARMSEVAMGYSTTQQGTTVSTPEEVWTFMGVAARAIGTRPTEEALAREVNHLNRMYESLDKEQRQKVVNRLRTAIRGGDIEDDKLEELALKYMDESGTPTGWRSAVRTAIMTTDQPLTVTLKDKLKDDSALNHMIDMLDEQ